MTAAQAPAPQVQPAPTAPAPATTTYPPRPSAQATAPAPAKAGQVREKVSGTPRTMTILSGLSIVACLLFAVVGASAVGVRARNLDAARLHAEQLVRVQRIQTYIVQSAAAASNEYLSAAGPDATSQRDLYTKGVAGASTTIAEASAAEPDDAESLALVNDHLTTYTGLIESARANNRQGYPVGRAYLKTAGDSLRTEVIPLLSGPQPSDEDPVPLVQANDQRVRDAYAASDRATSVLWASAVLTLLILAIAQVWLLVKTNRIVNVGLAAAFGAVVVSTVIAGAILGWAQSRGADAADSYAASSSYAAARIHAFDAKSSESLALIKEGNGQADEDAFLASTDAASKALTAAGQHGVVRNQDAATTLAAYVALHQEISTLDGKGQHEDAVAKATTGAADGANAAFVNFVNASSTSLDQESKAITDDLTSVTKPLTFATILVLVAGAFAAVASWWGFSRRLEEYR